jgi:trehalose-6-phosphate synthase
VAPLCNAIAAEHNQILVLSNREPCIHDLTTTGDVVVRRPASGLVSALEPVIQHYGGVWVATRVRNRIAGINRRFGSHAFVPITYIDHYMEPLDVFTCYRAADVCYVGSLDDGMNLVAKEFVSARDDERGVLVLSQFAGAARELTEALIVNPYDIDGVAETLDRALQLSAVEQRVRIREIRRQIAAHNVYDWASDMLTDAARMRRSDRYQPTMLESSPPSVSIAATSPSGDISSGTVIPSRMTC